MFIEVVSVEREDKPSSNGKGTYGVLTVTYRSNGKIAEKKLMSFTNPAVFKHFEKASKGDQIDVTSVRNDKTGYWGWTAIGFGDAPAATPPASGGVVRSGGNYETKEERAAKQKYIVKQSSLSAAVALLTVGAKTPPAADDVISLADKFVEYVFNTDAMDAVADSLQDDIPY